MNRFLAIASFLAPLSLAPSLEAQNLLERIRNPNADAIASAGEVASQQQAGDSLFAKAEEYAASGRQRQANDLYRQIVKKYPRSQGAAEAQYRIAEALDQSGDGRKAYDAYRELVTSYPNTRHFEIAVQRQFAITENLQQARKKGFLGFGQGTQSSKLIEMYGQIADLAPFSEYAPRSLLNIGQVLRKNGENGQALLAFQEVVTTYPGTAFSTEAQFEIFEIRGINAERSNSPVEDRAQADAAMDFVNQNPEDARAQEVQSNLQEIEARSMEKLYNTGRFYEKSGKPDSARVYYREVVKNPNTPWAAKAQERLVIIDSAPAPAPERTSSIRERAGLFGSKPDPSETAEMRTGGDEVVELPSAE